MNGAQLHLAFNHIPVIGMPGCFLLFAAALWRKSRDLAEAGFAALLLLALLSIAAFKTGGPAAHLIHTIPGILRDQIHEHAEAADFGFWESEILGVLGLAGLWLMRGGKAAPRKLVVGAAAGALFVTTVFLRIAHLGGLIRHPEISSDFSPPPAPPEPGRPPK